MNETKQRRIIPKSRISYRNIQGSEMFLCGTDREPLTHFLEFLCDSDIEWLTYFQNQVHKIIHTE